MSNDEIEFWNKTHIILRNRGYSLFILFSVSPKIKKDLLYATFTERLDDINFPKKFSKKHTRLDYSIFLEREKVWYGESHKDRLTAAQYLEYKYTQLFNELNPVLLVLGNGNHSSDMILKSIALKNTTPIVYIERGALPKSWHIDNLGITAGSNVARKSFDDLVNFKRTNSFEDYRSYYLQSKSTWWQQPTNYKLIDIKKRFNVSSRHKLILFANQLDNDTSNFLYNPFFKSNIDAFDWFCQSLALNNLEGFVLVKKHPHYKSDGNAFQNTLKKYNIDGAWVDDISLFDCIEQSDLICAVNSTMLFEALIYGKSVLQLGDSILNNKGAVYKLKNRNDYKTLYSWFNQEALSKKIHNYSRFMTYLIDNELSFFFKEAEVMELNSSEFFAQTLLNYIDDSRIGTYPKKFMRLHKYERNATIHKKIYNKIGKVYNKIVKHLR